MTTQKAFVNSVDEDQTAQKMQSDLWSTLSTFLYPPHWKIKGILVLPVSVCLSVQNLTLPERQILDSPT